jgi:hypothetical protein
MCFIPNVEDSGENAVTHTVNIVVLCVAYLRIIDLTNARKMEHIKIQQYTCSMLFAPFPTALPYLQLPVTRTTSGRHLGTFTTVNSLISPLTIIITMHLIARRSQFIICSYSSFGESNFALVSALG